MVNYQLLVALWKQFPTWDIWPTAGTAWMAVNHPTPTSEHCIVEPTLEELAKRLREGDQ